ncbi:MAG: DUF4147 domain-containing protein [Ardenticatenales bacterium]
MARDEGPLAAPRRADVDRPPPNTPRLHDAARAILAAALRAVDAGDAVRRALTLEGDRLHVAGRPPRSGPALPLRDDDGAVDVANATDDAAIDLAGIDRIFLVAAGKAARPMVEAAEAVLGDRIAAGIAIGGPDARGTTGRTTLYAGGHPLPDPSGLMATRHIVRLLADTTERDLVLVLLSGGASAMLEQPGGRMPLIEIAAATSALLSSGAPIDAVNTVRKHLSAVKGGGLLRAIAPAQSLTLAISDVLTPPGADEAAIIGSGPTAADPTTFADAGAVLSRRDLWSALSAAIGDHLRAGMAGAVPETVKPGDPLLARAAYRVIADGDTAVTAAAAKAAQLGYSPLVLSTRLAGEAREAGAFLAAVALECAATHRPAAPPACLIAAGETTVTLRRLGGTGGRNRELALAAALALAGTDGIALATLGTDGVDGAPGAAGAIADGTTAQRAAALGRDAAAALDRHDSGPLFDALGDAIVTGPTGTNVGDLTIALIGASTAMAEARP